MPENPNFPPVVPLTRANQFQKDFFPFEAFSADDPNKTATPTLRLIPPWTMTLTTIDPTKAPMPQAGAGVGQSGDIRGGAGGILSLPAGGAWNFVGWYFSNATGIMIQNNPCSGIAAGATAIIGASPGNVAFAWVWEIMGPGDFDDSQPVIGRQDGSYEITKGTYRFHVLSPALAEQYGILPKKGSERDTPNGWQFYREVTELWDEVSAWAKAHPDKVLPEPEPLKIPEDQQILMQLRSLDLIVSREFEDEEKNSKYQPRADAIIQKQALRARLAQLKATT